MSVHHVGQGRPTVEAPPSPRHDPATVVGRQPDVFFVLIIIDDRDDQRLIRSDVTPQGAEARGNRWLLSCCGPDPELRPVAHCLGESTGGVECIETDDQFGPLTGRDQPQGDVGEDAGRAVRVEHRFQGSFVEPQYPGLVLHSHQSRTQDVAVPDGAPSRRAQPYVATRHPAARRGRGIGGRHDRDLLARCVSHVVDSATEGPRAGRDATLLGRPHIVEVLHLDDHPSVEWSGLAEIRSARTQNHYR